MRRTFVICRLALPLAALILAGGPVAAATIQGRAQPAPPTLLPVDQFSPALLGAYRKVMDIEADIERYATRYGVDLSLAKAVCMYESGGNADLSSSAGARGYFQVMPATFRLMRVTSNVEAGIKYLGQLVKQFGREDYALAAYNGGPGRVARGVAMPLESLQYVIGVGTYRWALNAYEPAIRTYAGQLEMTTTGEGDTWWTLADRLRLPVVQLRLHNPFLAARSLRPGATIVYPSSPRTDLFDHEEPSSYRARIGDNYLKLAYALGVDPAEMRQANGLWRLQATFPGTVLTIPDGSDETYTTYRARASDTVPALAARLHVDPWWIVKDNQMWDEVIDEGALLRIRKEEPAPRAAVRPAPPARYHVVSRGDTLAAIARRYGTTVQAVQRANRFGRRTLVRIGQRLRIP
jgi:LysM repeat protein